MMWPDHMWSISIHISNDWLCVRETWAWDSSSEQNRFHPILCNPWIYLQKRITEHSENLKFDLVETTTQLTGLNTIQRWQTDKNQRMSAVWLCAYEWCPRRDDKLSLHLDIRTIRTFRNQFSKLSEARKRVRAKWKNNIEFPASHKFIVYMFQLVQRPMVHWVELNIPLWIFPRGSARYAYPDTLEPEHGHLLLTLDSRVGCDSVYIFCCVPLTCECYLWELKMLWRHWKIGGYPPPLDPVR